MAFDVKAHKLTNWIGLNNSGLLTKIARTYNTANLVSVEYKGKHDLVVGSPCLKIEYIYDSSGNIISENKSIVEWTSTQETIDSSSTESSGVEYWLGLENDGKLTKTHIGTATSIKQIFHYALPTTAAGEQCLQRIHHIDSSVIVSKIDVLGTWSSAMETIAIPAISDITLSAAVTVEDQIVGADIGTLAGAGSNPGHGTITWTLTSTTLSGDKLRIDGDKLEVGPNQIGSADAGTYNAVIKGTDELGGYREETFTITINSNDITDIALSAASVNYGDAADTAIGTLSYTGGVGTITPTITSNGGMTNLRLDGNILEVGPSYMNTAAGTYTVRITATDSLSPSPQTYYEDFTITVASTAITDIALSALLATNGAASGEDIGNLTRTGGVGDVAFSIQANPSSLANIKITDTGSSTATLEADTGGITSVAGSYSLTIRATDTVGQTYDEAFTISVASGFVNTKALSRTSTNADVVYFNYGQPSSVFNSGSGNFYLNDWYTQRTRATDSYSVSMWFKVTGTPDSSTIYGLFQSAANYASASGPLFISNKYATVGPNKDNDGTFKVGAQYGNGTIWHTPASSVNVADGEWHHFVLTWDGSLNSLIECTSTATTQTGTAKHLGSTGDANLKVYIDGEVCAYHANTDYNISTLRGYGDWQAAVLGPIKRNFAKRVTLSNSYEAATTPENYGWGFGYMYGSYNHTTLVSSVDEFSFHNIVLTSTQVGELYNSGTPISLEDASWTAGTWSTSNLLCWLRMFDGDNDDNTTIESLAGSIPLYDWDNTAGSEGYVASDPARTVTPTLTIKNGAGNEVVTLTALADGDVYIP